MTRSKIPDLLATARANLDGNEHRLAAAARKNLDLVDAGLTAALARMGDAAPGALTSRAPDAASGGTVLDDEGVPITESDPVGNMAARMADLGDPVRNDWSTLACMIAICARATAGTDRDALADAAQASATALVIVQRWAPRKATPTDRRTAADGEPGCESCARCTGPNGGPAWRPVARRVTLEDGRKVGLCEWCRTWVRRHGEVPTRAAVAAHLAGRPVRVPAVK